MPVVKETARTASKNVSPFKTKLAADSASQPPANEDYQVSPAMAGELEQLWRAYRSRPSTDLRNQLMECYLHLVRYMAERLAGRLSTTVDVDDLIGSGIFGLLDAVESFDPARGWKFETFCLHRVRGAIMDSLRDLDWAPRLVRRRANKMVRIASALQARLGRKPTREELFKHLQLNPEDFARFVHDSQPVTMIPFSRRAARPDRGRERRDTVTFRDPSATRPHELVQREDLKKLFLEGLEKQDRMVLELYYYEKMSMKEIGVILGLCESRVSQMHTEIMKTLRRRLSALKDELTAGGALG